MIARTSKPLRYAVAFAGLSILIEIGLLIAGFRLPRDTPLFAILVLSLAPPLGAVLAGIRGWRMLATVWPLTVVLTVVGSVAFGTVTGLLAPLIIRPIAGYAAARIAAATQVRRSNAGNPGAGSRTATDRGH